MKKLLLIMLCMPLFLACDNEEEEYNTKILISTTDNSLLPNNALGYYDESGRCILIADVGNINNTPKEITIKNKNYDKVYLFSKFVIAIKFDTVFSIKANQVNEIILDESTMADTVDGNSIYQYPH